MASSSACLSLSARRSHPVAFGLLSLLGSCAGADTGRPTFTPEAYSAEQQAYRTDPGYRAARMDKCIKERTAEPQVVREAIARLLAVDASKVDQAYCERLVAAVAANRVSYDEYIAIAARRADAATVSRFVETLSGTSTEAPSLRIEAADEFDAYARLLRETGRVGEADETDANAEKLRQAEREFRESRQAASEGRSHQSSTYLGFAPDRVLQRYAAELRGLGRTEEAGRAEALAARYREDQTKSVDELAGRARMQRPQ